MKIIQFLLVVMCMSPSGSSQTSDTCMLATRRAAVPESATALTDYDVAPLEFLFSKSGVDVYSATSYRRSDPLQWIQENGLTAIIVYQDEVARQRQIESLRQSGSVPARVGFPQHLENIKYAMVNFFGPSASFVRDLEYFEPKPCVSSSEESLAGLLWMQYADFEIWRMPGLHAAKNGPNRVTGFYTPGLVVDAKGNPMYVKIHNMVADKLRAYLSQHPGRGH